MALVFLSHAHGDEALVRAVVSLLRDGLDLKPDDFFVSSQGGRGVAPAASIRDEVLKELAGTPSLVVVVTPKSAGSPWVWLEAGHRLGRPDASNPLFAVPSERFLPLVQPVSDLRCIRLDHEEDLHEFVKAVGQSLGRSPQDVLDYNNAMRGLVAAATTAYGSYGGWRSRLAGSVKTSAASIVLAGVGIAAAVGLSQSRIAEWERRAQEAEARAGTAEEELKSLLTGANEAVNEEVSRTAARFLILKGVVLAGGKPIEGARVVASLDPEASPTCSEPDCTSQRTTSAGEFRLDLTRIRAQNGDDIVLIVTAEGFRPFSKQVRVDVRAIDVGVPAHTVALTPAGSEQ